MFGSHQVVVLWVGTNNHEHTAEQVAGGIVSIVQLLISRLPKAKIVILVRSGGERESEREIIQAPFDLQIIPYC